tara:strand:+ start:254 stop:853 length:600 start_codon:yes stop_codon:yes gene_type:complete
MEFLNLFPSVILQDTLLNTTPEDIWNYKKVLNSEEYEDLGTNGAATHNQYLLDNPIFTKLTNNIINLSKIYLDNLGHQYSGLKISNSWGNIVNSNGSIHNHRHANSYISGVYYLEDSSKISFVNQLLEKFTFHAHKTTDNIDPVHHSLYHITPSPNSIIIFPSYLYHGVFQSNQTNRLSIAFNIVPTGDFGVNTGKINI